MNWVGKLQSAFFHWHLKSSEKLPTFDNPYGTSKTGIWLEQKDEMIKQIFQSSQHSKHDKDLWWIINKI